MELYQAGLRRAASEDNLWDIDRCREPFQGAFRWRVCRKSDVKTWRSELHLCSSVHDDSIEREDGFYQKANNAPIKPFDIRRVCVKTIQALLQNAYTPESQGESLQAIKRNCSKAFVQIEAFSDLQLENQEMGLFFEYLKFFSTFVWCDTFKGIVESVVEYIRKLPGGASDDYSSLENALKCDLWSQAMNDALGDYFCIYKDPKFVEYCRKKLWSQTKEAVTHFMQRGPMEDQSISSDWQQQVQGSNTDERYGQVFARSFDVLFGRFFQWRQVSVEKKTEMLTAYDESLTSLRLDLESVIADNPGTVSDQRGVEHLLVMIDSGYLTCETFEKLAELIRHMHQDVVEGHRLFPALLAAKEAKYLISVIQEFPQLSGCRHTIARMISYALARRLDLALIKLPETYRMAYRGTILHAEYTECYCPAAIIRRLEATTCEAEKQGKESQGRYPGGILSLSKTQLPPEWKIGSYKRRMKEARSSADSQAAQLAYAKLLDDYIKKEKESEKAKLAQQLEQLSEQNSNLGLSDTGVAALQGRRERGMEDRFLATKLLFKAGEQEETMDVMMVCDGHGSCDAAEYMCREYVSELKQELEQRCRYGWSLEAFYNALVLTPVKVSHGYTGQAGTTAVIALIHRKKLYACNVGDSTVLLINPQSGKAFQLSAEELMDQKSTAIRVRLYGGELQAYPPGQEKVLGLKLEGKTREPRLSMSSAIGDSVYGGALKARANVSCMDLRAFTGIPRLLVFCYSDGVSEVDNVKNIARFLCQSYKTNGHMPEVTKSLAVQSYLSGSSDNITILGMELKSD